MIDKNITTKLHFFLCFGMVISICYWANCIRGKTTISRKSKKCRIVCWKFLFVAGSTANDRIALLQAFNVNEMRPRNCALLAMSFINEVVNLVPKHDVFIVECYPILAIMCNISERYDVNSHDFFLQALIRYLMGINNALQISKHTHLCTCDAQLTTVLVIVCVGV